MKRHNSAIRFEKQFLDDLVQDEGSCVEVVQRNHHLALHPYHLNNISESLKDILNKGIAKYDKNLGGILLGYTNIKLLSQDGVVTNDSFFIHVDLTASFYIFKAEVGKILTGTVNKKSRDHVGCLVHKTFNVSLPRPDNEDEWMGAKVEIGQDILFRITFTNLEGRLPYIRATFVSILSEQDSGISTSEENVGKATRIVFDSNSEDEVQIKKKKKKRKNKDGSEDDTSKIEVEEDDETRVKKKKHKHKSKKGEESLDDSIKFKHKHNSYEEPEIDEETSPRKSKRSKLKDQDDFEQQDVKKHKKHKHQNQSYEEEEYLESKDINKKKKSKHKPNVPEDAWEYNVEEPIEENIRKKKKHSHENRSYEQDYLESEGSSKKKSKHKRKDDDDDDYININKIHKHQEEYLEYSNLKNKKSKTSLDFTDNTLEQTAAFSKNKKRKHKNKEFDQRENEIETQIWETQVDNFDITLPDLNLSNLFNESSPNGKLTSRGNFIMADNEDKKSRSRTSALHAAFWDNNLILPSISDPEDLDVNTSAKHKSKKKNRDAATESSRKRRRSDSSDDFEISKRKKRKKD